MAANQEMEDLKMNYEKPKLEIIEIKVNILTVSTGEWGSGDIEDLT